MISKTSGLRSDHDQSVNITRAAKIKVFCSTFKGITHVCVKLKTNDVNPEKHIYFKYCCLIF